jgi:NADH-quinone oxidoreductase subunit A
MLSFGDFVLHGTIYSPEPRKNRGFASFSPGDAMHNEWLYVAFFFIVGLIIPVGAIGVALILGPKKPNPIKQLTYECGLETVGDSWVQFKAQYYIFALVFLIFDVETVFLFPWAVKLGQLGLFAVVEGIIFITILIVGLVYTWRKGMLEWA